jgi:NAD(P)-dependent dehydrogenase (short-subunit alcohol dehydrogenase family)
MPERSLIDKHGYLCPMSTALVTGPNSGIGLVTTLELARSGFHVVAAGRSAPRIQPVIATITSEGGSAEFLELDLSSFASVRSAAARFIESGRHLDLLVNNAGIGVNRRGRTKDGFEVHFGINHLGHFLLTREVGPALGPGSRVASVSSAVHFRAKGIDFGAVRKRTTFIGYPEYAVSKLANILFISELARRRPELNAYAVHPGLVDTPLIPWPIRALMGRNLLRPEQGADTVVWCATSDEVADESGHYYQLRSIATPSLIAQDDDLARELWERSEEWCG